MVSPPLDSQEIFCPAKAMAQEHEVARWPVLAFVPKTSASGSVPASRVVLQLCNTHALHISMLATFPDLGLSTLYGCGNTTMVWWACAPSVDGEPAIS